MRKIYHITFEGAPITKKNSSQIMMNKKKGRPFIMPSKAYKDYEKNCIMQLQEQKARLPEWVFPEMAIDRPVNVKMLYYMPTRRKVDLTNLQSATLDVLVACKILADDNSNIVVSTDGSRVYHSKEHPRVEIMISPTFLDDDVIPFT